ncbi:MAG: two-component regulator propeller domain-containing protein [Crocinitomicaceae bacterium]
MYKSILLFLICFLSFFGLGQHYYFKTYSLQEGLSRSGVYHILQDNKGFLWIGTEGGGVSKFDGHQFTNFGTTEGLKSEHVRIIFEDSNGMLWFGTDNGLSFFEYGEVKTLTTVDGLSNNFVRSITQDHNGNLWVGTDQGISIIDPSEKEISSKLKVNFNLPHKKIRSLLADSNKVWIGTDNGLCKIQDGKLSVYTKADGLTDNIILSLFIDKQSNLWIGTNNGLSRYENGNFKSWTVENGLINNRIRTICEDSNGQMWFGTKKGISILHNNRFININGKNGLSNERIRCIQKDSFGNIWIGTYFGGIMRFNYRDFISFSTRDGLPSNQILSIAENKNKELIIGSFEGATILETIDSTFQTQHMIGSVPELIGRSINTIYRETEQTTLYGTDTGLLIVQPNKTTDINSISGLLGESVKAIFKHEQSYYIGTELGINEIKFDKDFTNSKIRPIDKAAGLAGNVVSFIKADQLGRIWIGFIDGQISILHEGKLINPKLDKNINRFTSIEFDDFGKTWLGTSSAGLFYGTFNNQNQEIRLNQFSIKQGLTSNSVFSLLIHQNKLWIGHEKGLDVLMLKNDSVPKSTLTYGLENGFLGLQNNMNASYIDSKNNLWFGTVNGLFCLNKNSEILSRNTSKSINYIQSVKINSQVIDWTESEYCKGIEGIFDLPVDLELPYDINTISFDFVGINFVMPKKIKFTWRLKGFENDFRPLVTQSNCDYTNLAPGRYTFQLKTTNENGQIIDDISEFSFIIKKPFWQTWGFRVIAAIAIFGFLLWYLNYRTKKLRIKQRNLEETIAVRTQEIVLQNTELEKKNTEIEAQHDELSIKNKEITDSIVYSRRIQRSLLPSSEKMSSSFENHFVLYMPKDIISGDFYWTAEPVKSKNKKIYFAVADCTGHGVPGAMVSVICTRALNSSILEHKLRKPKDILEKTNAIVLDAFTDKETGTIIKDGMDIALGLLEYSPAKLAATFSFSGAHNSAWIVMSADIDGPVVNGIAIQPDIETESHKLYILAGIKQPVGDFDKRVPFPQLSCELPKGTFIYLYTDGYADQFGGTTDQSIAAGGKKFKYKPFKELILKNQNQSLQRQEEILAETFNTWRQGLEQVDDVCVMCIEV